MLLISLWNVKLLRKIWHRIWMTLIFGPFLFPCKFNWTDFQRQMLQVSYLKIIILNGRILDNTGFVWHKIDWDQRVRKHPFTSTNRPEHWNVIILIKRFMYSNPRHKIQFFLWISIEAVQFYSITSCKSQLSGTSFLIMHARRKAMSVTVPIFCFYALHFPITENIPKIARLYFDITFIAQLSSRWPVYISLSSSGHFPGPVLTYFLLR